jgi:hypothetical protein
MVRAERFLTEARRFSLLHSMPELQGQLLTEKARAKRGPGGCLAGSAFVFRRRSRRRSANHKLLSSLHLDGRYRIRTYDPLRVKQELEKIDPTFYEYGGFTPPALMQIPDRLPYYETPMLLSFREGAVDARPAPSP